MGDFRGTSNFYRPVMSLGYLFCYQLFGPRATGFHAVNVALNLAVVLLVFLITLEMFHSSAVAMVAACLFALHPIHSEAVDWIAAVTEVELSCFLLLTFWIYLRLERATGRGRITLEIVMSVAFALALLSKEQALTFPLLATLYEHFFRQDRIQTTAREKFSRYGALWLLTALYLVIRVRYLGEFAPFAESRPAGPKLLIVSALALVGRYCGKLLWPVQLCAYYVFPVSGAPLYSWAAVGLVSLAIGALIFWGLWRVNRQAAFGIVWLFANLGPVLNIHWMTSNPFAERYLYLASLGFCWIIGWGALQAWSALSARSSRWRFALPLAAAVMAILGTYRIVLRNRDWRENVIFYVATLSVSPNAYYIHNNLGTVYWERRDIAAADREWQAALRLAPTSEYVLHNLGLVAKARKQYPQAEALFLRALAVRPNYSDAHLDLGLTYQSMGRLPEALAELRRAEKLAPLNVRAHNALSEFYFDTRQLGLSEEEARRSVEIVPTPQGYWDLGLTRWLEGNRAGAEQAFLSAEAIDADDSRAHFMLALLYMDSQRIDEAIREYRAGLKFDPSNAQALANLNKLEMARALH